MLHIADLFLGTPPMTIGNRYSDRFMLWIDAVGGYWVCLGDEITLGQPDRRGIADVPILGDLSSRHAIVRRVGEDYLIEALHEVRVDDHKVHEIGRLRDGSRIQLGESVRILFRRPNALSRSARLDFVSRHHTQPSADAVLLMADTCILGPKPHSHIVCRDWKSETILYRSGQELFCRAAGTFEIDGAICKGRGRIARNSRIEGDGFSFKLEVVQQ
jgi:hypothetical protein